jgi:hypothetical protein
VSRAGDGDPRGRRPVRPRMPIVTGQVVGALGLLGLLAALLLLATAAAALAPPAGARRPA